MSQKHQHRRYRSEIRSIDQGRRFETMPLAYEVVDDYGTIWTGGVFDAAVEERMPLLLYGHNWADPANLLGQGIDYRDTPKGPLMTYEFTSFDDHPHTRQLAAQINDGTLTDLSVGFDRWTWTGGWDPTDGPLTDADKLMVGPTGVQAVERMLTAGWDETSLVVRGAVPGAKVLSGVRMAVRTAGGADVLVPQEAVLDLARKVTAGEITSAEAQAALALIAGDAAAPVVDDDDAAVDVADALAEADALLEDLEV